MTTPNKSTRDLTILTPDELLSCLQAAYLGGDFSDEETLLEMNEILGEMLLRPMRSDSRRLFSAQRRAVRVTLWKY